jgi:hypothetical protein
MSYEEKQEKSDRQPVEQPKLRQWEHWNGKNEKHAKQANAERLSEAIKNAEKKLADLKATGGPKNDKRYWAKQIKHFRRQLHEGGTEDSRIGKNQFSDRPDSNTGATERPPLFRPRSLGVCVSLGQLVLQRLLRAGLAPRNGDVRGEAPVHLQPPDGQIRRPDLGGPDAALVAEHNAQAVGRPRRVEQGADEGRAVGWATGL